MAIADSLERYLSDRINSTSLSLGIAPIQLEMHLNSSAEQHSQWMISNNIFDHTGVIGSDVATRIRQSGIALQRNWAAGENISFGSLYEGSSLRDVVDALYELMLRSPTHYANTKNPWFSIVGIGICPFNPSSSVPSQSMVITQNFAYTTSSLILDTGPTPRSPNFTGDDNSNSLSGFDSDDLILGNGGDDFISGGGGNDTLQGGEGNDTLFGGAGFDRLFGGYGDDTVYGGFGRDRAFLGDGDDQYIDSGQGGWMGADVVHGGNGNDYVASGGGNDSLYGGNGNDVLEGGDGDDLLSGGNQGDQIYAGNNDDTVEGGNGRDTAFLGNGNDRYTDTAQGGWLGADRVFAGNGNDYVDGGGGNDTLNGGNGDDTLVGGSGDDVLSGGADNDMFIFSGNRIGHDVITDFSIGSDQLAIDDALWRGIGDPPLNSDDVVSRFASVTADGVMLNFGNGNTILLQGLTSNDGLSLDLVLF